PAQARAGEGGEPEGERRLGQQVELADLPVGGADDDGAAPGEQPLLIESRVVDRHAGRGGRELRGPARPFRTHAVQQGGGVEAVHLVAAPAGEAGRVEDGDVAGADPAGPQARGELGDPVADAGQGAAAGEDDAARPPGGAGRRRSAVARTARTASRLTSLTSASCGMTTPSSFSMRERISMAPSESAPWSSMNRLVPVSSSSSSSRMSTMMARTAVTSTDVFTVMAAASRIWMAWCSGGVADEGLGTHVGPGALDVFERGVAGAGGQDGGPAGRDGGELGPDAVLPLVVDQHQEGAV